MMYQDVVIVIPAYEPDEHLLELLKNIRDKENHAFDIVLVDDGSGAMTGMNVSDTQTGLRVIPMSQLPKLLTVKGERYEFEMNMLLEAKENNIPICEVSIATIYLDENQSSHFDVIRDSIKIYKVFFKYIFSSLFFIIVFLLG